MVLNWGNFAPVGYLAMPEDISSYHNWEDIPGTAQEHWGHLHCTGHLPSPDTHMTKNYLALYVHSDKAEKPWSGETCIWREM